nr:hypothetical protein [Candidatus Sigynarchaeum springense]
MGIERQETTQHSIKVVLTHSVAKRCLIASLLAIPGLLHAKHATSIDMVLSSAVAGCVVMVLVSIPLAYLASGSDLAVLSSRLGKSRRNAILAFPFIFSGTGIAIAVYHGLFISPVNLAGLTLLILMTTYSIKLTSRATMAPVIASDLIAIDVIMITGGLFYGTIAGTIVGVTGFPSLLVIGTGAIACLVIARGMVVRLHHENALFQGHGIAWLVLISASISLMLVALLVVLEPLPMIYPALASAGCSGGALLVFARKMKGPVSQRMIRKLISSALICSVISVLIGSI